MLRQRFLVRPIAIISQNLKIPTRNMIKIYSYLLKLFTFVSLYWIVTNVLQHCFAANSLLFYLQVMISRSPLSFHLETLTRCAKDNFMPQLRGK